MPVECQALLEERTESHTVPNGDFIFNRVREAVYVNSRTHLNSLRANIDEPKHRARPSPSQCGRGLLAEERPVRDGEPTKMKKAPLHGDLSDRR